MSPIAIFLGALLTGLIVQMVFRYIRWKDDNRKAMIDKVMDETPPIKKGYNG